MKNYIYIITFKRNKNAFTSRMIFDNKSKAIKMAKFIVKTYECYVEFDFYKKSNEFLGNYELQPIISTEIEKEVNK